MRFKSGSFTMDTYIQTACIFSASVTPEYVKKED